MKKQLLVLAFSLTGIMANAADWDGVSIAADPPPGNVWELNPISDGFNYASTGGNRPSEFTDRWNENYINGFSGPSATSYHADHAWTSGGYLNVHANWAANMPIIYTGCISSKAAMSYPMFMEAKVKLASCMLANNVWMISADETEELDMMETYPNSQDGNEWYDGRIHLSHHTFIRQPFTDYQPRSEEDVHGTWYWEEGKDTWRGEWLRVGMYWRDPDHVEYFINGEWVRTIESHYHSFKDPQGNLSEHRTTFDAFDKYAYIGRTGMTKPQHIIINMEQQSWLSDRNVYPTPEDLKDENGRNIFLVDWIRVYDAVPAGGAIPVTGVSVSTTQLNLAAGETGTINHALIPANATKKAVIWTTSNSSIATVNAVGVVTAVGQGTCTADVVTADGSFRRSCTVTVTGNSSGTVNVSEVILALTSVSIEAGETHELRATVLPINATDRTVVWSSDNENVATVVGKDTLGVIPAVVTGVAPGTATITVTTNEGAKEAIATITVTDGGTSSTVIPVTGVSISPTPVSVLAGSTITLSATVVPSNATNQSVTWSSDNTSVATVNGSGVVTGKTQGNATITVTTSDGNKPATITVTVTGGGTTPQPGNLITIEAESFTNTNGTFSDGKVPGGGANKTATNINWVNNGDYMDYPVNGLEEGSYEIVYYISSKITGSTISFSVDGGAALNATTVPNNGQWDAYARLTATETVNINAGDHTIRLTAGAQTWTWNLDKFTLQRVGDKKSAQSISPEFTLYPNPANNELNISLEGEINENARVNIFSSTGKVIVSEQMSDNNYQISLDDLSSGMYILQVINGGEIITERFIKE